jgi:glycosyltransferase involved in cell wall biosynthesis
VGFDFIYTNHGLRFRQKTRFLERRVFGLIEGFVIGRARSVVCIRNSDVVFLKNSISHGKSHIKLIETRIDSLGPDAESHLPLLNVGRIVLIGVGSIIDVKRVDRFIDWLSELSRLGFEYDAVWLGDGPLRAIMEQFALDAQVKISWRGYVAKDVVQQELMRATLLLLTSDFEVMSLAALEAMASGTPIITTDFIGVSDFVMQGENGVILRLNVSAAEAASSIAELIGDFDRLTEMGRRAFAVFKSRFSGSEAMAIEYEDVYSSCIAVRRR